VPAIRTEITEIVTGLSMLGFADLDRALTVRPDWLVHVGADEYHRLEEARHTGRFGREFETAWENGRRFLRSPEGLRGRMPERVEWKGPHKPPGYEQLPADLRVDHVYLISCKYGSNLLHNASPSNLFDRLLADRRVDPVDWYLDTAPEAYAELYRSCRRLLGDRRMPADVSGLEADHRAALKEAFSRTWPDEVARVYASFAWAVASASAERWRAAMAGRSRREQMLWRLLRLEAAPYFVLGASGEGSPLAYRTETPWDFRYRHVLRSFDVWPDAGGQPLVRWRAEVTDADHGRSRVTEGHIEVRWSHGRFAGAPEAKVYLDTPHHEVAGYVPLPDGE
jgi:hypothetical protein